MGSLFLGVRRLAALVNRRSLAAGVVFSLLSSVLVVVAVRSDGIAATSVQLNDGSVWVVDHSRNRVGRLNVRIQELDTSVAAASAADVLQDGRNVVVDGPNGGVKLLNVLGGGVRNPSDNEIDLADYRLGPGLAAAIDVETGGLWVGRPGGLVAPDYPDSPDVVLPEGSQVVVTNTIDGRVDRLGSPVAALLVVGPDGWFELPLDDNGKPDRGDVPADAPPAGSDLGDPPPFPFPNAASLPVPFDSVIAVTSVGAEPLVLTDEGRVGLPGGAVASIPGDEVVLQQPGPRAESVLVASTEGLFSVGLDAGTVEQLSDLSGPPAAPVRVDRCVYGAWSAETPVVFKQCDGAPKPDYNGKELPNASPGESLVWRVNQGNVALNSPGNGGVWADHDGDMAFVGNWADVEALSLESEQPDDSFGESLEFTERSCVDGDTRPTAGDDELGVRPRQTIVNLLTNDDDLNCEPIAVESVNPVSGEWGQLTIIDNGQHVLFSPSGSLIDRVSGSSETFSFEYVVNDTSGNRSTPATATLTVFDYDINTAPALLPKNDGTTREMRTQVEEGRAVSYDVMVDWWDPQGDELRLVSAQSQSGGEVAYTPEGIVRFGANGVAPGKVEVLVTVSDGRLQTTETLEVTVKPTGIDLEPVVADDFVTVAVGETAVVEPLANDSDPNEDRLDLRPLWNDDGPADGYRIEQRSTGVLELTGLEPGIYGLRYGAYDGVEVTEGMIRLVVLPAQEQNTAPVAVPDQVKIRANRVINVDVLSNDIDLDGDILSVAHVSVGSAAASAGSLGATVIDRELVQLEVRPGPNGEEPTGPFTLTYRVVDGNEVERAGRQTIEQNEADALQALGSVTVLVQGAAEDQPPLLEPDRAVVRSQDVVAVPVLRNDTDPDGDKITLESVDPVQAAALEASGQGTVWVDGRNVYFQGADPGQYSILYNVLAGGRQASAELTVEVRPLPVGDDNQAPAPLDLTLRAVRNSDVRLAVPLFGVDPDGDSVELLAEFSEPLGAAGGNRVRVDDEDPNVIIFEAGARSGATDSFTYTVRDRFGARGTAVVNVVVLDIDAGPQAFDDVFIGKPGRTISIPVLANDSSPLDRPLEMAAESFFDRDGQPTATPVNPTVVLLDQSDPANRGRVEVVVPAVDDPTLVEHYRITDGRNPSSAYIRVSADPDTPNLPPVANRDLVAVDDLEFGAPTHLVDVLANDLDPDDVRGTLSLDLPAGQNGSVVDGQVEVNLERVSQTVLYRVTDADGASAVGRIVVPAVRNRPPRLNAVGLDASQRVIEAASPDPLFVSLLDILEDPEGDDFELTDTEVRVLGNLGSVVRSDDNLGFTFTPPPELQFAQTITIRIEVTDRAELSLDERRLPDCECVVPIEVDLTIAAASPPRVLAEGSMQVPQLDEPVTYDLAPLTVDDQDDELTYVVDEATLGGLRLVSQAGSEVTLVSELEGDQKIPLGSDLRIRYTVQDSTFDPVENSFVARIIQTNKGEPTTTPITGVEATRDEAYVDLPNLIDRAFNPFADSGRGLTLENATISPQVGLTDFTCTVDGDCTFFTDTVGTYTATYTLRDAVDQTVTETIELNVKGLARAPGIPSIESVGDHQVTLSWTAADMQGGAFSHYVVTAVETGQTVQYAATGGVFDQLVNGDSYTFTVYAVNELGDGEISQPSSPGVPDRVPSAPESLQIVDYQDQTLFLQWAAPADASDYTTILQYEVSIGGYTVLIDGASTSVEVGPAGAGGALLNGTPYTFRVRAQNSATTANGWGAWSGDSISETPSRFPDAPTGVAAANSGDGGNPRLTVTWNAPAFDGGRPIGSYRVCRVEITNDCQTVTALAATFAASRNQGSSFVVTAFNSDKNRNDSDPSAPSSVVTAVGVPDAPVISSVTSADKQLTVNATTTNNSGCSSYTIQYSRDGGTTWQGSNVFTGLVNGQSYPFVAQTVLGAGCYQQYTSVMSASRSGIPYGPLVAPSITAQVSGTQMRWNWRTNRSDDGRPDWSASLSGNCGNQALLTSANASGWTAWQNFGYSATRSCTITVSAGGVISRTASASGTTVAPPPPTISLSRGSFWGGTSYYIDGSGSNFTPGAQYWISCTDSTGTFVDTSRNIPVSYAARYVDGAGNLSWGSNVCFNYLYTTVRVWTSSQSATATIQP